MKTQQTKLQRMTTEELASRPPMYKTTADGRTQYLSPSERREQAQPDTARHSPLPWSCESGDLCDANDKVITEIYTIDGKLIVRAVNNADKLAEALRKAVAIIKSYDHVSGIAEMQATLADYDRSAQ